MINNHNEIHRYPQLGSWEPLSRYPKNNLAFVTIILGGIPVNGEPIYEDVEMRSRLMIEEFRKTFSLCVRKRLPGLIWRGRFEYDLRRGAITGQRAKLFQFLSIPAADHILVPHVHFVAALEEFGKSRLRVELARTYRGPYRVYVSDLFAHQSVLEALSTLQSYAGKQRTEYCSGGIDGQSTKFQEDYEGGWKGTVERLYRSIPMVFQSTSPITSSLI